MPAAASLRVGILTTSFPRTPEDSAGSFVLGFARALVRSGARLDVLAPQPSARCAPFLEPEIALQQVRYLWPRALQRTFYGAGVPENLARDPLAWLGPLPFTLALARRTRELSVTWDAVVSHWALPCALVAGSCARARPHLAVLHSADVHALCRLPGGPALARRVLHGASGLWFVSEAHRRRFAELLDRRDEAALWARSWATPMGIDLPDLAGRAVERERARAALGLQRTSLLALGRLVPVKGLDVLLRALAGHDCTLLLAGSGPEEARLRALARELRVDARFLGHVAGSEKAALLMAADVFVVPSRVLASGRSEGVPVALLEAMAYALPIVASAVGGICEIVPEGDRAGMLVPPDQPALLARALERASSDSLWRARAGGHAREIAERHAWDRTIAPALHVVAARGQCAEIAPTP